MTLLKIQKLEWLDAIPSLAYSIIEVYNWKLLMFVDNLECRLFDLYSREKSKLVIDELFRYSKDSQRAGSWKFWYLSFIWVFLMEQEIFSNEESRRHNYYLINTERIMISSKTSSFCGTTYTFSKCLLTINFPYISLKVCGFDNENLWITGSQILR